MTIDFHDTANANTYASRRTHPDWFQQMQTTLVGAHPGIVADVGCGGGIYSRAWRELGAKSVIGIDSSVQMIQDARATTDDDALQFAVGDAYATGLDDASCEIVFSRAVVHHLDDHDAAMAEAFRILRPGGLVLVQDRSIEDVVQPATAQHFRALFFSTFPRLLDIERKRRPGTSAFLRSLETAGFEDASAASFWETRRTYDSADELGSDLMARTGRSILHELNDEELTSLTGAILAASAGHFPLEEHDRWTIWTATKPTRD